MINLQYQTDGNCNDERRQLFLVTGQARPGAGAGKAEKDVMNDGKIIGLCVGGGVVVLAATLGIVQWMDAPAKPVAAVAPSTPLRLPAPAPELPPALPASRPVFLSPPIPLPAPRPVVVATKPARESTYEGKPVSHWINEAQTAGNPFRQSTALMTLGYFPGNPDALKAVKEAWFFYGNGPEDDYRKMATACSLFTLSAEDRPAIVKWSVMRLERDGLKFLDVNGFELLALTMGSDARSLLPQLQRLRETEKSDKWHKRLDEHIERLRD